MAVVDSRQPDLALIGATPLGGPDHFDPKCPSIIRFVGVGSEPRKPLRHFALARSHG